METSACLVSFPSRCTLLFDPGVGTPPEARGLGGGELDSKISVRDCVSGTVCPGVRRPVGAHGVLVGGGRGVGGLVGGLVGSGTRTWPGGGRNDLYKMVQVLNTHLPRLSGRNIRTWRSTAKPAIWKSV